jgi:hypothetical protein
MAIEWVCSRRPLPSTRGAVLAGGHVSAAKDQEGQRVGSIPDPDVQLGARHPVRVAEHGTRSRDSIRCGRTPLVRGSNRRPCRGRLPWAPASYVGRDAETYALSVSESGASQPSERLKRVAQAAFERTLLVQQPKAVGFNVVRVTWPVAFGDRRQVASRPTSAWATSTAPDTRTSWRSATGCARTWTGRSHN